MGFQEFIVKICFFFTINCSSFLIDFYKMFWVICENMDDTLDIFAFYIGLVTSRAEPSFEHFELGLLIYERARA